MEFRRVLFRSRGSESRSRYWTDIPGTSARQRATMAALSSREAELAPRALESMCNSFMMVASGRRQCRDLASLGCCCFGINMIKIGRASCRERVGQYVEIWVVAG